jgi:hypothetical protein
VQIEIVVLPGRIRSQGLEGKNIEGKNIFIDDSVHLICEALGTGLIKFGYYE